MNSTDYAIAQILQYRLKLKRDNIQGVSTSHDIDQALISRVMPKILRIFGNYAITVDYLPTRDKAPKTVRLTISRYARP